MSTEYLWADGFIRFPDPVRPSVLGGEPGRDDVFLYMSAPPEVAPPLAEDTELDGNATLPPSRQHRRPSPAETSTPPRSLAESLIGGRSDTRPGNVLVNPGSADGKDIVGVSALPRTRAEAKGGRTGRTSGPESCVLSTRFGGKPVEKPLTMFICPWRAAFWFNVPGNPGHERVCPLPF